MCAKHVQGSELIMIALKTSLAMNADLSSHDQYRFSGSMPRRAPVAAAC